MAEPIITYLYPNLISSETSPIVSVAWNSFLELLNAPAVYGL